jgi:uncharacterized protein YnzC (UPF0291/DUF896 family)
MKKTMKEIRTLKLDDLIKEINYLANEKKLRALTEEELAYQKQLRQRYLELYRQNFREQMKSITIVNEEGKDVTPEKIKKLKQKK